MQLISLCSILSNIKFIYTSTTHLPQSKCISMCSRTYRKTFNDSKFNFYIHEIRTKYNSTNKILFEYWIANLCGTIKIDGTIATNIQTWKYFTLNSMAVVRHEIHSLTRCRGDSTCLAVAAKCSERAVRNTFKVISNLLGNRYIFRMESFER